MTPDRLFLDDERFPPDDGQDWAIVRSVAEAQAWILTHGCPAHLSFDNDLGEHVPEGWRLAQWLIEQDLDQPGFIPAGFTPVVHSQNCVRAQDIPGRLAHYLAYRDLDASSTPAPRSRRSP
jgi:hypothetical protein